MTFIKTFLSMLNASKNFGGYYWNDPLEGNGDNAKEPHV